MRYMVCVILLVLLSVAADQARADPKCRECRGFYHAARSQCERSGRFSSSECGGRALEVLEECLRDCGFFHSLEIEPVDSDPVADPELVVSIADLSSSPGRIAFSLALDTSTTAPFRELIVGFASLAPGVCEIADVRLGSGLLTYIAENEEPPACDIVIFPPAPDSPAASITKLFLDVPYDSQVYGSEYLVVELNVTADHPSPTVIQLFEAAALELGPEGEPIIGPSECDSVRLQAFPAVDGVSFIRGDANGDTSLDLSDAVVELLYLFAGTPLGCLDAADVDDDGSIDISDPILLLNALFGGALLGDFACGADESADDLSCDTSVCGA